MKDTFFCRFSLGTENLQVIEVVDRVTGSLPPNPASMCECLHVSRPTLALPTQANVELDPFGVLRLTYSLSVTPACALEGW